MHLLIKIAVWMILFYLAYCCLLFLLQRQMMFPRGLIESPPDMKTDIPDLEKIWLNTSFGKTEAWFLPPVRNGDAAPAPVAIFAHGNAELIDFWPEEFRPFTHLGIGVLLVEYPGYGRSAGTPSHHSIAETFVAAYDHLSRRADVDASRMILIGRSIGGGAVCQLAAKRPSAALILMSTFVSARSFAAKYLVPGFFVQDPFDNQAVVRDYPNPVLIIHGKRDEMIPHAHGTSLCKAAKHCTMITYDCGHNDCPPDQDIFWRDIEQFLRQAKIIR